MYVYIDTCTYQCGNLSKVPLEDSSAFGGRGSLDGGARYRRPDGRCVLFGEERLFNSATKGGDLLEGVNQQEK